MEGCLSRMGQDVRSDLDLDPIILHLIFRMLRETINSDRVWYATNCLATIAGAYLVMSFVLSLRGHEEFILDLQGLIQHISDGRQDYETFPHVIFPLLGCLKNKTGERWYLMLVVDETSSGLKVGFWMEQLVALLLK